eukprot:5161626-Amphidinium_carterae.1
MTQIKNSNRNTNSGQKNDTDCKLRPKALQNWAVGSLEVRKTLQNNAFGSLEIPRTLQNMAFGSLDILKSLQNMAFGSLEIPKTPQNRAKASLEMVRLPTRKRAITTYLYTCYNVSPTTYNPHACCQGQGQACTFRTWPCTQKIVRTS